jgi:hypothetical protein
MNKLSIVILIVLCTVVLVGLTFIVEKKLSLFKKMLKIQYIIFIPLMIILTIFDFIKTNDLIGIKNRYGLFLFIAISFIVGEILLKFIFTFFPCYSKYDIYLDASNHRYVFIIFLSNLYMLIIGIYTILCVIDEFVVNLKLLPL